MLGIIFLVGFKNIGVFSLFKSVILEGLCKTFESMHRGGKKACSI